MKTAQVWCHNLLAGEISETAEGTVLFQYDTDYLLNPSAPPISVTFPKQESVFRSRRIPGFFDGLIPEGWLLDVARVSFPQFGKDRIDLLFNLCEDTIGAVSILSNSRHQFGAAPRVFEPPLIVGNEASKKIERIKQKVGERCLSCLKPVKEELYHKQCSLDLFGTEVPFLFDFSVDEIEKLAVAEINQRLTVTGAQRKLSLSLYNEKTSGQKERHTTVNVATSFILKPAPSGCSFFPAAEHITMHLAQALGQNVAHHALVPLASGELCYVTRRFDRVVESKTNSHVTKRAFEDFGQIFDQNVDTDKYKSSIERVGKWIVTHAKVPGLEAARLLEQVFFSWVFGNCDMHLKNLGVLTDANKIVLSPAFDLVATQIIDPDKSEQAALAIHGKKNDLGYEDWLKLTSSLRLTNNAFANLVKRYQKQLPIIDDLIANSFLPEPQQQLLMQYAHTRLESLL